MKVCAFEPGLAEVCVLEAGAAETGTREIGPLKVCFLEILAAQFGPGDFLSLRSARHCSRPSDSSQIWCIASTGARDWVLWEPLPQGTTVRACAAASLSQF